MGRCVTITQVSCMGCIKACIWLQRAQTWNYHRVQKLLSLSLYHRVASGTTKDLITSKNCLTLCCGRYSESLGKIFKIAFFRHCAAYNKFRFLICTPRCRFGIKPESTGWNVQHLPRWPHLDASNNQLLDRKPFVAAFAANRERLSVSIRFEMIHTSFVPELVL